MKPLDMSSPHQAKTALRRWFTEVKTLLVLGLPLIISHLAIFGMAATDTIMAGHSSTTELAGLAIGASLWSGLSVLILGMCGSTATIAAHLHGAGRLSRIGFQLQQSLWIGTCTALIVMAILFTSPLWLGVFTLPESSLHIASDYLRLLSLGAPAFMLTAVWRGVCEATGDTLLGMWVNLLIFLMNAVWDYLLVFGIGPFPTLGASGCAWASNLSYWVAAIGLALYLNQSARYKPFHLFSKVWKPHGLSIKQHLALAIPLAIGVSAEVFFFSVIALVIAPLGERTLAAHQVVINYGGLIYMIPLGLGVALCIRCAQLSGAQQPEAARWSAFCGITLSVAIALITAGLTLLGQGTIVQWYSKDVELHRIAMHLLIFCALYQVVDAIQATTFGALRGFGDAKIPMILQLTCFWIISFPLGYFLAYSLEMSVSGFWLGIIIGLSLVAAAFSWRLWGVTLARSNRTV